MNQEFVSASMRRIEVVGPYLENKGDVLMVSAIKRQLGDAVELCASSEFGSKEIFETMPLTRIQKQPILKELLPTLSDFSPRLVFRAYRKNRELVTFSKTTTSNVDAILDCNGFCYGDQWGFNTSLIWRAGQYETCRARGGKVILFPQSFGPFEDSRLNSVIRRILKSANLVFARDTLSLEHLKAVGGGANVELAADFTNLLFVDPPVIEENWRDVVAIVPNRKMLKYVDSTDDPYYQLLDNCIQQIESRGFRICLVLHEHKDMFIYEQLCKKIGRKLNLHDESHLETKSVLGACRAVISSRFHGLINSLSQGVPSLGTSWSHKFDQLLAEFECSQCLVRCEETSESIKEKIDWITNDESHAELTEQLKVISDRNREGTRKMWQKIHHVLETNANPKAEHSVSALSKAVLNSVGRDLDN